MNVSVEITSPVKIIWRVSAQIPLHKVESREQLLKALAGGGIFFQKMGKDSMFQRYQLSTSHDTEDEAIALSDKIKKEGFDCYPIKTFK